MRKKHFVWGLFIVAGSAWAISRFLPKSQPNYSIEKISLEQPVDHNRPDGDMLTQYVYILKPNDATSDATVLFVLGGEGYTTEKALVTLYKAYGERPNVIIVYAEHRGYGESLSMDEDQTVPDYVTVDQALADFHAVMQELKPVYPGKWIIAGYSYSGGLAIAFASRYPDDVAVVLSSSGVVDWPFVMDVYDAKVREILGERAYQRLVKHINNLEPEEMFDQNWLEREFLIAFVHGISQYLEYKPFIPVFNAATRLPTPMLLKVLHGLDNVVAQGSAWDYAISNGKTTLTREEALTLKYNWRVWRYQQCNEIGLFEISAAPNGIFTRTKDDFVAECAALFGENQPRAAQSPAWSLDAELTTLTMPLVYVAGALDPWEALGAKEEQVANGRFFWVPDGHHCQDRAEPALGREVMDTLLRFAEDK